MLLFYSLLLPYYSLKNRDADLGCRGDFVGKSLSDFTENPVAHHESLQELLQLFQPSALS